MEGSTDFYSPPSVAKRSAFGLDIKHEPEEFQLCPGSMQKVPSLSDLSEADSGVDTSTVAGHSLVLAPQSTAPPHQHQR